MRVLHLMAGAKEGGAESIMVDAALALAEAGVIQHVITRDHNPARLSALRQAGVLVSIADFGRFWRRPTKRVIQLAIDDFRPDILQFWMARAGTFALKQWRARSVGWYGGYYKVSRFKNCAWHVGMTRDIAAHIVRDGISPERVSVLNSYANVETSPPIARSTIDTPDDAPVILTLARLHEKKGIDTLLEALVGLPGVHAWIAGAGPIEEELKALSRKLGVTDRAPFLGWRTDRANLLAACNLVAIPSRYEPFGNVVIEACGGGEAPGGCRRRWPGEYGHKRARRHPGAKRRPSGSEGSVAACHQRCGPCAPPCRKRQAYISGALHKGGLCPQLQGTLRADDLDQ